MKSLTKLRILIKLIDGNDKDITNEDIQTYLKKELSDLDQN